MKGDEEVRRTDTWLNPQNTRNVEQFEYEISDENEHGL